MFKQLIQSNGDNIDWKFDRIFNNNHSYNNYF